MTFTTDSIIIFQQMVQHAVHQGLQFKATNHNDEYQITYTGGY